MTRCHEHHARDDGGPAGGTTPAARRSAVAEAAADRLRGRRILLVGTGTSWHAANIGAWFLRAAGVEAWAVQAADAALHAPAPAPATALILLSHRGTKRYTTAALADARRAGAESW